MTQETALPPEPPPAESLLLDHPVMRVVAWVATFALLPAVIITPLTLHQQLTLSVVIFSSMRWATDDMANTCCKLPDRKLCRV